MKVEMSAIHTEVRNNPRVDESVIILVKAIAARIDEIKSDPPALAALVEELNSSSAFIAHNVVENTIAG